MNAFSSLSRLLRGTRLSLRSVLFDPGFGYRGCDPSIPQKVPLPFTVLLLLIGLAMGALNREYGPHGSHHADDAITLETHEHGFFGELWAKTVDTLSGAITWGGTWTVT